MIRVTRIQTFEFDPASEWYGPDVTLGAIRRIETSNVEDEGDKYFAYRERGATEITVEQIEEERQVA